MHWSNKHRVLNPMNGESHRSFSSKNSIIRTSGNRGCSGMRPGSSISKPPDGVSSRNFSSNENHASVHEPSSWSSTNIELPKNTNNKYSDDQSNNENMRLDVLRNNVSTSDMFHWNQMKKMSINPPSSNSQRNLNRVNYKCSK